MSAAEGVSNDVLAERIEGVRRDVAELAEEQQRNRARLHNLEGFAAAYLDVQREHRRQEDRQYRRIANAIALGGLVMAAAMVALTLVTILAHR